MTFYEPPDWAGRPLKEFWLEEIKNGQLLAQHPLEEKTFFVVGSDKQNVDICYEHPLTSRRHAVLQFDDKGSLYVFDISRHGTLRNQEQLPSRTYVELSAGDQLKFGHSPNVKRIFAVCAENSDEDDEDNNDEAKGGVCDVVIETPDGASSTTRSDTGNNDLMMSSADATEIGGGGAAREEGQGTSTRKQRLRDRDVLQQCGLGPQVRSAPQVVVATHHHRHHHQHRHRHGSAATRDVRMREHDDGSDVSWGLGDDALDEGEEHLMDKYIDFETGLIDVTKLRATQQRFGPKQDALACKLEEKHRKLGVLLKEIAQLDNQLEAPCGVSEAAIRLRERRASLDERHDVLESEVEQLQRNLAISLGWNVSNIALPPVSNKMKQVFDSRLFDEEDEFYDRTASVEKNEESVKSAETEASLTAKVASIKASLEIVQTKLNEMEVGDRCELAAADDDDADALDVFMAANAKKLETEERDSLVSRKKKLENELACEEGRLAIIRDDGRGSHV